jgi:hypothetical protein
MGFANKITSGGRRGRLDGCGARTLNSLLSGSAGGLPVRCAGLLRTRACKGETMTASVICRSLRLGCSVSQHGHPLVVRDAGPA